MLIMIDGDAMGFLKWQVPVLVEQEDLSYVTGAVMKIEDTMMCGDNQKLFLWPWIHWTT